MDAASTVLPNGAIYVDGNTIVAATDRAAPAPPGFSGVTSVDTGGFIYPGLIELHNHLSYDALPLWDVPKRFSNRGQWQSNRDYVAHVSGPMGTIAKSNDPHLLAALVRYVETKCLLGGVTTSQGISLKGDHLETYYHSAMRVVDDPADKKFPRAATHIPDIAAANWDSFKREVDKSSCLLLHLSEGLDTQARTEEGPRMGDRPRPRRYSLRGVAARGLCRHGGQRRIDGLVAAQQLAAVRRHRRYQSRAP